MHSRGVRVILATETGSAELCTRHGGGCGWAGFEIMSDRLTQNGTHEHDVLSDAERMM